MSIFQRFLSKRSEHIFWTLKQCTKYIRYCEKPALIIHEENTKEIMSVKEFVYLILNHADLPKR